MQSEVETGRFEAFSDGVFAIAIALPIVEVGVSEEGASRTRRLAEQRPRYAAYALATLVALYSPEGAVSLRGSRPVLPAPERVRKRIDLREPLM